MTGLNLFIIFTKYSNKLSNLQKVNLNGSLKTASYLRMQENFLFVLRWSNFNGNPLETCSRMLRPRCPSQDAFLARQTEVDVRSTALF